jgi:Bacteriophage tail sheath protein
MAVTPTYPGVYIEEVPSGVHTITGVATSITAFVGYTQSGTINRAVHIFSFADFERGFGGVTADSLVSRAVRDFFQNGGTEAYIVRVAQGAQKASVDIKNSTTAGTTVLTIAASSEGTWGNNLRVDVDYDTFNPDSLFNISVTELIERNGALVPGRTEMFRNLSMDSQHPNYVQTVINGTSSLISATRPVLAFAGNGTSTSAVLNFATDFATPLPAGYRLAYTLNGQGPFEITVSIPTPPAAATLAAALAAVIADVQPMMAIASPPGTAVAAVSGNTQLRFTATTDATHPAEQSSIHFVPASRSDASKQLKLGLLNGGIEVDAAAAFRPVSNGTSAAGTLPATATGQFTIDVLRGATVLKGGIALDLWGPPTTVAQPTTLDELVAAINTAFAAVAATEPLLSGARASRIGGVLRIVAVNADPNISLKFTGATATTLNLNAAAAPNVIQYAPGTGITAEAQLAGNPGNNGTPPSALLLAGTMAAKTGLYALEDVDLFNLLVIPEASEGTGQTALLAEAIAYCIRRRAFMIVDAPATVVDFAAAQVWAGTASTPLRSRNSALYYPRVRAQDPLKNNIVGTFPAAGAIAGLYARTDAERGVWKAPAGLTATIAGAVGTSYVLTDGENGTLNPLGINCLRTFPIYGTVAWGARTGNGADAMADEYKYIPVRRLALFLEESLYRGTQWVVFEPNDEPLWAQIRLNLGAFMHTLFAQGAFQGKTPREAYFVKCDKETTTQNDIDLGRVNIVVGFAPLKPAEFVIIRIQQIVRDLQT